jgi:hypothetical protein
MQQCHGGGGQSHQLGAAAAGESARRRLAAGVRRAVFSTPTITIPPFSWADAPPGVPPGLSDNAVETDRNGSTRSGTPVAGAHAVGG